MYDLPACNNRVEERRRNRMSEKIACRIANEDDFSIEDKNVVSDNATESSRDRYLLMNQSTSRMRYLKNWTQCGPTS